MFSISEGSHEGEGGGDQGLFDAVTIALDFRPDQLPHPVRVRQFLFGYELVWHAELGSDRDPVRHNERHVVRPASTADDDLPDEVALADRLFDRRGTDKCSILQCVLFAEPIRGRH